MNNISVITMTAPADWASYLINGDPSGLGRVDIKAADMWLKNLEGYEVVGIVEDQEPRFTWSYMLYGGICSGGDVIDYELMRR